MDGCLDVKQKMRYNFIKLKTIEAIAAHQNCYEQHFCSCPPWLSVQRFDSSGHEVDIHFTKQNYNDQFAILGKSKVRSMGTSDSL